MLTSLNLPLILSTAFLASASPGPATLAIADTSMQAGRRAGLALALGVATGSLAWSSAAALGLAAVMASSTWAFEAMRYLGAAYLLFLAFKSARNAIFGPACTAHTKLEPSPARTYAKGLALHLTNPKPVLFFGSLYTLGVSHQTALLDLAIVIVAIGVQNTLTFSLYAWLFSNRWVSHGYLRLRRWFEAAFAVVFAAASLKVLTARLPT
ncbi:LysE family translocator [uncultured Enterovirga sp.]|uniref:LysE family translocator n=1 Tax=uncultured Enterovirga sp. TaxID=2026352 RepID=UPI0035CB75F8